MGLEIGPLQEIGYTGVAKVISQFAAHMLAETDFEVRFFVERKEIPNSIVKELVHMDGGKEFAWIVKNSTFPPISVISATPAVGIFASVKTAHFLFDYEAQFIHDLSVLLVPQYHHIDTIRHHAETLVRDVSSNDLNICVSEATRSDLERYFPEIAPRSKNLVAHPAWYWPDRFDSLYRTVWADHESEPYILVLGTIEPRKNIDVVFDFITNNPAITNQYKFVFLGKHGWGDPVSAKLQQYSLSNLYEDGRLIFPGFVGEFTKYVILSKATLVIYPSLFEGFGLPVVEALSLGKAVVTTASSSIPEVGGDAVYYFNPFEAGSFGVMVAKALYDLEKQPERVAARSRQRAEMFSWSKFYWTIRERISQDLRP
jgi:glycosyltransferase involved in cell wall biosynthesis